MQGFKSMNQQKGSDLMLRTERLSANDRDEALSVLNRAFSNETHTADFERNLPIMWTGEHDYMARHFGIREDGKLIALLGVYPLPVSIAGHELLFSTVGNVATLQEARGKGCMKLLMDTAMKELTDIGADASRLDGLRSRYNRFGYDHAGQSIRFTLTSRNASENPPSEEYRFVPIEEGDTDAVSFARACQQRSGMYALRKTHLDFFMSMKAWQNIPYLAIGQDGAPAGYLCVSPDGKNVAEAGTAEGSNLLDILCSFILANGLPALSFTLPPWDAASVRPAFEVCESWFVRPASMFKIVNWDRVAGALLDLSASLRPLPDGTACIGIKGWGTLELTVSGGRGHAARSSAPADLTFDPRAASQLLFGPLLPSSLMRLPQGCALASWLPLPLSWNGQDRV